MISYSRQKSFPILSPSKSTSSLPIDISKTLDKSNNSSKDKCIKLQIFPYTISTTDQSSFRSCRHSKPTNPGFTSPHKKIKSLRNRMNSMLNTLNRKNISQEQYLIQKKLVNKYFESSRNVNLIKNLSYSNKYSSNKTSKDTKFRINLIRDFTGENKFVNYELKINRAKEYYQKQIDLIHKNRTAKQKELNKIIEELDARKGNKLFSKITCIKDKANVKHHNNDINQLDFDQLEHISEHSLKAHYNNKLKQKKQIAKQITEEIQNIDAKPYEKLFNKKGKPLERGQIFNENNLKRKIKLHNITYYFHDKERDELCVKSPETLKSNMLFINAITARHLKGHCPPYVKQTFKNQTIGKYTGLNGVYFSMS